MSGEWIAGAALGAVLGGLVLLLVASIRRALDGALPARPGRMHPRPHRGRPAVPGDEDDGPWRGGVREPRKPVPASGAGAAALPLPEDGTRRAG